MANWRAFKEARAHVRKLGLASSRDWAKYCNTGERPADIPAHPERVYKLDGWKGMGDWLGTETVAYRLRKYREFAEARAFARGLGLRSGAEWIEYCQSGKKPADIPANVAHIYRSEGFAGWGDWLGTGNVAATKRSFRKFVHARAFVRRLCLASKAEYHVYSKSGMKPRDIPASPHTVYKKNGWVSWADWLGHGRAAATRKRSRMAV